MVHTNCDGGGGLYYRLGGGIGWGGGYSYTYRCVYIGVWAPIHEYFFSDSRAVKDGAACGTALVVVRGGGTSVYVGGGGSKSGDIMSAPAHLLNESMHDPYAFRSDFHHIPVRSILSKVPTIRPAGFVVFCHSVLQTCRPIPKMKERRNQTHAKPNAIVFACFLMPFNRSIPFQSLSLSPSEPVAFPSKFERDPLLFCIRRN